MIPLHQRRPEAPRATAPDVNDRQEPQQAEPPSAAEYWLRRLALAQGAYYAATGLWSIVSLGTFQRVTGPKVDRWLVKTVGVLVTAGGAALMLASREGQPRPSTVALGAGSAAGLAAIDFLYSARGRISKVYALDGIAEVALCAAWLALVASEESRRSEAALAPLAVPRARR